MLQATLPSIMFTILRVGSALQPFPWNDPDVANNVCGATAAARALTSRAKAGGRQQQQEATASPQVHGGTAEQPSAQQEADGPAPADTEQPGGKQPAPVNSSAIDGSRARGAEQQWSHALCHICSAPISSSEVSSPAVGAGGSAGVPMSGAGGEQDVTLVDNAPQPALCCRSCEAQILADLSPSQQDVLLTSMQGLRVL
jgi:hypothetical protein